VDVKGRKGVLACTPRDVWLLRSTCTGAVMDSNVCAVGAVLGLCLCCTITEIWNRPLSS
jgi:hypothetical protein